MPALVTNSIPCAKPGSRDKLRHTIAGEHTVTLVLDRTEPTEKPGVFTARLLDLSPQGARLALPAPLPAHKTLLLTITIPEMGVHFCAKADVCWTKQSEAKAYAVGCRLSPKIPENLFRSIVAQERLERCEVHDHQDRGRFQFIHRLDDTVAPIWGTLVNHSRGGFCFHTAASQTMGLGDRIQVVLGEPAANMLVAVVCWKLEQGSECLLGCRYLGHRAAERLQQAIHFSSSGN